MVRYKSQNVVTGNEQTAKLIGYHRIYNSLIFKHTGGGGLLISYACPCLFIQLVHIKKIVICFHYRLPDIWNVYKMDTIG